MGRAVEFAEVVKAVERFGPLATLVTIDGDRDPHVGTVLVTAADDHLVIRVGTRTRENVVSHPMVSLAWVVPDRDYQLIIDGTATIDADPGEDGLYAVGVDVERGILHRVAGRTDAGPSCLSLSMVERASRSAPAEDPSPVT